MTVQTPDVVRQLDMPAAGALADLAAVFDDLQAVLRCCERLVAALAVPAPDELTLETLWTTTLLSYARCFAPGAHGMGLTTEDVTATELEGAVADWHGLLLRMRDHVADPAVNPRERFAVGVSQDAAGVAAGIAVTSTPQPRVDEVTVRQTGALAYALMRRVDARIEEHQRTVFAAAGALTPAAIAALPEVTVG